MSVRKWYTITRADVGKRFLQIGDRSMVPIGSFAGVILPQDVGKRIYNPTSDCPQMENREQFQRRCRF